MNIHISIDASSAEEARYQLRQLLGDNDAPAARTVGNDPNLYAPYGTGDGQVHEQTAELVLDEKAFLGETQANTNTAPTRKRGEPSPGHKRRTKAEIAEDAAAEANALAESGYTEEAAVVMEKAGISTGGERVAPDDDPAVEQQDVADEADETAKAGAELSHENLRDALGKYVQKYGMDAAQLDGPKLFGMVFKDPAITKISAVPGDQKSLKSALDGINEMLAKNPFDRKLVA